MLNVEDILIQLIKEAEVTNASSDAVIFFKSLVKKNKSLKNEVIGNETDSKFIPEFSIKYEPIKNIEKVDEWFESGGCVY